MAQKSRIHQHLVKPLIWREAPEGLYPFPLFWMEGKKDMEGFGDELMGRIACEFQGRGA